MSVIAIDCSRRGRVLCVLADEHGRLLGGGEGTASGTAADLPGRLAVLLGSEVRALVAVNGPGSYTGVRAGLAAALGVAAVRDLPVHVLGALEVAAQLSTHPGAVRVLADAGRGGLYTAVYQGSGSALEEREGPQRLVAAALPEDGLPRRSLDQLSEMRATVVDGPRALAAAVVTALHRAPIDRRAPPVTYLGTTQGAAMGGAVPGATPRV